MAAELGDGEEGAVAQLFEETETLVKSIVLGMSIIMFLNIDQ